MNISKKLWQNLEVIKKVEELINLKIQNSNNNFNLIQNWTNIECYNHFQKQFFEILRINKIVSLNENLSNWLKYFISKVDLIIPPSIGQYRKSEWKDNTLFISDDKKMIFIKLIFNYLILIKKIKNLLKKIKKFLKIILMF